MKTVFLMFINVVFCNAFDPEKTEVTAQLPDFRRRMEEIIDETTSPGNSEDPSHIVSFLIQNVKEIFKDTYDNEDDDEESQTDSVNIQRRKLIEMVTEDTTLDKIEAIADVNNPESSTENEVYYTLNKPDTSSSSPFRQHFNMKFIDELKNERDLEINHHNDRPKYEPDFEDSTVLFRPVFQIMTRYTTERAKPSTAVYFQNRATKYFNPEFELQNESVLTNDDSSSLTHIYSNKSYIHPFPFLISKHFESITARQPNTAKGLMFLAGPGTEIRVTRTTINGNTSIFAPTRTPRSTIKVVSVTQRPEHFDIEVDKKEPMRSCIRCNNAAVDWCSAPKNKLIPSTLCKIEGDLCYSMHTPFGIVDRGCYNINHNMSTHVCGCNLCNYINFKDLPVIFASKQEWIQDIFNLTHFKSLRKSTMKKLSCMKCEVNNTIRGDTIYNRNCMEGNLGVVRSVNCKEDEICGTKAIKNQGYIWRGCISAPLYNYYITLCDSDLCNYDPIASVYDINY